MLDQMIIIYCICDEATKFCNIQDDIQCKMSSAEIMTFAIMTAEMYGGNYQRARLVSVNHRYFSNILSLSQLVRRIHKIPEHVWYVVFMALQLVLRNKNCNLFIIDSFPVKAYENHKSFRAKIFAEKKYHGYCASKKLYFFGIKVHMIVDIDGVPIELIFTPGSASDVRTLQSFPLELGKNSMLMGDKAYTNYQFENFLQEYKGIKMLVKRRSNLSRQNTKEEKSLLQKRNKIETVFSAIVSRMPRSIKARTEKGFCLKIFFFILAYMFNMLCPLT